MKTQPMSIKFKASMLTLALASLALVGCNSPEAQVDSTSTNPEVTDAAAPDTTVFECPGGETITAQFDAADAAIVTLPDAEPVTLAATEAASGARYSDGTTTLWNKGDEVMVEIDDAVVLSGCKAQN
jgi:membrane-bound inhibitor of C-type lysozyme